MQHVNSYIYAFGQQTSQMSSSIGARVLALRLARKLSQPELARRVRISQPSLHNIETNKTKTLRGATLAGLCKELGVTPSSLMEGAAVGAEIEGESELTTIWRSLTTQDQSHVLATARAFRERMIPSRRPPPTAPTSNTGAPTSGPADRMREMMNKREPAPTVRVRTKTVRKQNRGDAS